MQLRPQLDTTSAIPIYRQIGRYLQNLIEAGNLHAGDRLPPTRELADQLGLNRTTVSAAYALLESNGFIKGSVGRGSFVCRAASTQPAFDWSHLLSPTLSPLLSSW